MSADKTQVGGTHYTDMAVQPWDAMRAWMTPEAFAGYLRGACIKYLARCDAKGGVEDLRKARHYLDKLIETKEVMCSEPAGSGTTGVTTPTVSASAAGDLNAIFVRSDRSLVDATRVYGMVDDPACATHDSWIMMDGRCTGCGKSEEEIMRQRVATNWTGPDWSQAPEWATHYAVDNHGRNKREHWFDAEPVSVYSGCWSMGPAGVRYSDAPDFNYSGHWRDSLRRRPA